LGGKHNAFVAVADIAGGKINGFIAEAQRTTGHTQTDVMGYHDAREIPNRSTDSARCANDGQPGQLQ
jgi:hypothetical protein